MKTISRFFNRFKARAALFATIVGILFRTDDDETEDRPLANGSDLFGEHNFRTGKMDSGGDPDGWYDEDM